ncbi:DUF4349 domain-containing protein [Yinghuangia sp. ASG 101]|uniref:DUF4349 domain-containing protein n=1 Tax=Yinghuangia sp. ASG 101 TaxID=2896848 RepID=UPI001E4ABD31|nr:DUF4349 domain-containing protein [Yinghuangia sp. ASG 101]UGQ13786.1 DUF4349 domain-containing protein [Yinghuangia sp. ASG 101]
MSLTLLLGACSGGDGGSDRGTDRAEGAAAAPNAAAAPTAVPGTKAPTPASTETPGRTGDGTTAGEATTGQAPAATDRKLVLTAEVRLEADNPEAAAASARSLAVGMGGMVGGEETRRVPVSSSIPTTEDTNSPAPPRYSVTSTLTLKVPPAQFDKAIDELSALGTVVTRNRTATDVTEQVVDVASRVETQRKSVDRVRQLLAQAGTIQEIISLESELTEREAELDSLLKRQQSLAGQVDLATIAVTVSSPAPTGSTPRPVTDKDDDGSFGGGILDALKGGGKAFVDTVGVVLRVAAAVLPFAALAIALWLVLRRFDTPLRRALARRRTRRRAAHDAHDAHEPYETADTPRTAREDDHPAPAASLPPPTPPRDTAPPRPQAPPV